MLLRYLILLLLLADDEVSSFKDSFTSIKKSFVPKDLFVVIIIIIFSMYLTGMLVQIEGFDSYFRGKPLISVNNYYNNISPLKLESQKTVLFPYFKVFLPVLGRKFLLCFATKCNVFTLRREMKHLHCTLTMWPRPLVNK